MIFPMFHPLSFSPSFSIWCFLSAMIRPHLVRLIRAGYFLSIFACPSKSCTMFWAVLQKFFNAL